MAVTLETQNGEQTQRHRSRFRSFFARNSGSTEMPSEQARQEDRGDVPTKWSMGVLNDRLTHEVPGSVLLLANLKNEPLGLRNAPARTSHSSLPSPFPERALRRESKTSTLSAAGKKKTPDGAVVLEPQPDDSDNDPLNWPSWRRDMALISVGLYCMIGGGMTPILAAGFNDVAKTFDVTSEKVALTTGLYMMGMGVGSVIFSPTAILFGKRPVYLLSCLLFVGTSVWCAASPSWNSLAVARVFQGVAVSPVECLPSATIAEIFFLHERAFRIGIYTLLLLGGKNLVPLVSAAVISSMGWRWVFWIVAMIVGAFWFLLFFFVPETFWDRTPRPRIRTTSRIPSIADMYRRMSGSKTHLHTSDTNGAMEDKPYDGPSGPATSSGVLPFPHNTPAEEVPSSPRPGMFTGKSAKSPLRVGFSVDGEKSYEANSTREQMSPSSMDVELNTPHSGKALHPDSGRVEPRGGAPPTPGLHNFNSPFYSGVDRVDSDYMNRGRAQSPPSRVGTMDELESEIGRSDADEKGRRDSSPDPVPGIPRYTTVLRKAPKRSFVQQLRPFEGRLTHDNWFRVAFRPMLLYAYPAVLWSSLVYACSVGWLIVISESMSLIYRNKSGYNFSALGTGLVYISPFIGGVLGTAVAGKLSDVIVMAMARRNGGLYEPEFRLVMVIPTALSTVIGLMGFGWSAEEKDNFWVPTIFFGLISFGCSLGSTTAITFCVDSYRQYAGEALVTLNFSKNIFHGLVFSLFMVSWLEANGSKQVYICLGAIQLAALLTTIPMYIFGKRARMWTVRKNFLEKF